MRSFVLEVHVVEGVAEVLRLAVGHRVVIFVTELLT